jgi:two-component system sensor histidine kinase TctE
MTPPAPTPRSGLLEHVLLRRLLLPVLTIVVCMGALGAYGAQVLMNRVFDRWLLDTASALAGQVHFDHGQANVQLSPQAEALLTYDVIDHTYFELIQNSKHLHGYPGLPTRGQHTQHYAGGAYAYDAQLAGVNVRVIQTPLRDSTGSAVVLIAETSIKRESAQHDLLLTMAPMGILILAAAIAIGLAVRHTIQPLETIAARWNQQSHVSLEPIPTTDVPQELLPFASALNDLLKQVRTMLERERQFAATAAHQLRTPLAGLQLGLARAATAPDLSSTRIVLKEMGPTLQRTSRLVQQLLALSQLAPEAQTSLRQEAIDLVELAHEVGESYFDAAFARHIELEFDAPPATAVIRGNSDLIAEALGNLIDNAIRYTKPGGHVLIHVDTNPPRISIEDSGPGIAAKEQARMFERFVRGEAAEGEGSGLGLAIVKEIMGMHEAQIFLTQSRWGGLGISLCFGTQTPCQG